MLPAEFLLYWKRAFRVVLPVVLAMDMLHSMYYVAGLYQKRLQVHRTNQGQLTSLSVLSGL